MLALLQHSYVFLPLEEGVGAPGCHWTQQSGHRLSTVPEDLDLTSIFSCCLRLVGKEITACVQLECHLLFTSSFSYFVEALQAFLPPAFIKHIFLVKLKFLCNPINYQFSSGKSTCSTKAT